MGVTGVILKLGTIFFCVQLVAPLLSGVLDMLGVGDYIEVDAEKVLVQRVLFYGLGVGTAVFGVCWQIG